MSCLNTVLFFLLTSFLLLPISLSGGDDVSTLKRDEEVLLLPSYATLSDGGDAWTATLEGIVYEPEEDSIARGALLDALIEALDLDETARRQKLFLQRARPFLYDHERGKRVCVRVRGETFCGGPSGADGRLEMPIRIPVDEEDPPDGACVAVRALLPDSDDRQFTGRLRLTSPEGWVVVSDIDDTIKISEVGEPRRLLERTFLEPFEAAPGMARAFSELEAPEVAFHYVSNSPWQLHEPLESFLPEAGFPRGVTHLRRFRWKDRSFREFLHQPDEHKRRTIERLLKDFPRRKFILVGDTTERDPAIYADLARRHGDQVVRVLLRNTRGDAKGARGELETTFRGLSGRLWEVFAKPTDVDWASIIEAGSESGGEN